MSSIIKHCMMICEESGLEYIWSYLNVLIRTGVIEEGTAEEVADIVERSIEK